MNYPEWSITYTLPHSAIWAILSMTRHEGISVFFVLKKQNQCIHMFCVRMTGEHFRSMPRENPGDGCNGIRHLRQGQGRGLVRHGGKDALWNSRTTAPRSLPNSVKLNGATVQNTPSMIHSSSTNIVAVRPTNSCVCCCPSRGACRRRCRGKPTTCLSRGRCRFS